MPAVALPEPAPLAPDVPPTPAPTEPAELAPAATVEVAPPPPAPPKPAELSRAPISDFGRVRQIPQRSNPPQPQPRPAQTPTSPTPAPGKPVASTQPQSPPSPGGSPPPLPGGGTPPLRPNDPGGPRRTNRTIRPPIGNVAAKPYIPASLRQQKPGEKPGEKVLAPKKRLTDEEMRLITGVDTKKQVERIMSAPPAPGPTIAPADDAEGGDEDADGKKTQSRRWRCRGRRHSGPQRSAREAQGTRRKRKESVAVVVGQDGRVDVLDDQDGRARRRKAQAHRKIRQAGTMPRVGKVPINSPITVRPCPRPSAGKLAN